MILSLILELYFILFSFKFNYFDFFLEFSLPSLEYYLNLMEFLYYFQVIVNNFSTSQIKG